jgi:hypothetical protein
MSARKSARAREITAIVARPLGSRSDASKPWYKNRINRCFYFTFREHPRYNITHGQNRTFFG